MRNRRAFTLVEMLVVVAIMIAVLAILVPSLDQAIALTEVSHCQSNMRQIMYASVQYAASNRQSLPQPGWLSIEDGGAGDWTGAAWLYKWPNLSQPAHVEKGALWPYLNDFDVYHCIAHPKPWGDAGPTEAITSYVMNGSICDFGGRKKEMRKLQDYQAQDIIFWENDELAGAWNDGSNFPFEKLTSRHQQRGVDGAGNVAMIDGSIEWIDLVDYNYEWSRPGRTRLWNKPYDDDGR